MRLYLKDSEKIHTGEVIQESGQHFLIINGEKSPFYLRRISGKTFYSFDQKNWEFLVSNNNGKKFIFNNRELNVFKGFLPSGGNEDNLGSLVTQMPGKVVKVLIEPSQSVKKGQTLLILEAMKMENEIKAGIDGTVKAIHVEPGDSIDAGHLMVELDAQE